MKHDLDDQGVCKRRGEKFRLILRKGVLESPDAPAPAPAEMPDGCVDPRPRAFAATREDLLNLLQSLEEEKYDGYARVSDDMPETSPEVQYAKGYEDGISFAMKLVRVLLEKA